MKGVNSADKVKCIVFRGKCCRQLSHLFLDFRQMSAQTVFSALDYLKRWSRARAHSLAIKTQLLSSKGRAAASISGTIMFSFAEKCTLIPYVSCILESRPILEAVT